MLTGRLLVAGAILTTALSAAAQTYPAKPVRLILPFPAGGPTDFLGRLLGQKLAEQLGQPVVPENRPGAAGNVGAEFAAKQPPDGYTIVLAANTLAISRSLYRKLGYDVERDLAPVSLVAQIPNVFLVHPSVPAKNLKDLVAVARANPGKLTFGSGGLGTGQHLAVEILKSDFKVNMLHVPYKGSGQALTGMIGGHIDLMVIGVSAAVAQIQSAKVRALAVLSADRLPVIPDVPTAKESGFPTYVVTSWYGILAPAGTPREVVGRLNAELEKILKSQDARERLQTAGLDPLTSSPERFGEHIKSEIARYAKVIREGNLVVE